jgi:hypothetical protein
VHRINEVPEGAALMFNCQMGRGRTTTGMITAALLYLRRAPAFPGDPLYDPSAAPAWFQQLPAAPATPRASDLFKAGHWGVVRSLLRVLELGQLGKSIVDAVIDAASAMQNLREAIAGYRGRILSESKEHKRAAATAVCLQYLERCAAGRQRLARRGSGPRAPSALFPRSLTPHLQPSPPCRWVCCCGLAPRRREGPGGPACGPGAGLLGGWAG